MADISRELQAIMLARKGKEVRGSIHDAIDAINKASEVVLTTGTVVNSPTSSSVGFYVNSLYLNTSTYELWKCAGTNLWTSLGIIKGANGEKGADGAKGADGKDGKDGVNGVDGKDGENGNRWFRGTLISGKNTSPTAYASGIEHANIGDNYLNSLEGAIYYCVSEGDESTALWSYEFTLTGGGSGGVSSYNDLDNKPTINGATIIGSMTSSDLGVANENHGHNASDITGLNAVATSGSYNDLSNKPQLKAVATSGSYNDLSNKPTIPSSLYQLTSDSMHRTVADTDIENWNDKSFFNESVITEENVGTKEVTWGNMPIVDKAFDLYAETADGSMVEIISTRAVLYSSESTNGYVGFTVKIESTQVPVKFKLRHVR